MILHIQSVLNGMVHVDKQAGMFANHLNDLSILLPPATDWLMSGCMQQLQKTTKHVHEPLGPSIKYVTLEGSRACDVTLINLFTIHTKHEI